MELHFRIGNPRADEALLTIVGAFEDTFAADHCRYVLLGSYATGAARDTSDLDLLIVFARPLTDTDGKHAGRLIAGLNAQLAIETDVVLCSVW